MALPLEGIRVLDLTRVLAGPYCTMVLSDLGAEVVKVEQPGKGDDSRHFGPFKNDESLYFVSINREKKSISLNLKTDKGKDLFRKLVPKFDVIVENFRPGVMEKLGLGFEALKKINPRLIYAASSGFGHSGPDSLKPAYDILVQAMGGIMSITGWPDSPPTRVGASIGDITAALFTAIGVVAALHERNSTGKGQKIDVAMLDCQVAILENALARFQVTRENPKPLGNRHPTITPFQVYSTADDYVVVAIGNDSLWKTFCLTVEREELLNDPRFADNGSRTENLEELNAELYPLFAEKTTQEWLDLLENAGIPHARINGMDQVMHHPQVLSRQMIVDLEDRKLPEVKLAGNPIKMDSVPDRSSRRKAPAIGENNEEIFGLSREELKKLADEGVV
ncbi:MAG: CaiB/BaiF CoA transferase family protein [Spirochaetaceae bacterium]